MLDREYAFCFVFAALQDHPDDRKAAAWAAVDAISALPLAVTDDMVERAVKSWITAPGDFVHARMRAALEAAVKEPPTNH